MFWSCLNFSNFSFSKIKMWIFRAIIMNSRVYAVNYQNIPWILKIFSEYRKIFLEYLKIFGEYFQYSLNILIFHRMIYHSPNIKKYLCRDSTCLRSCKWQFRSPEFYLQIFLVTQIRVDLQKNTQVDVEFYFWFEKINIFSFSNQK